MTYEQIEYPKIKIEEMLSEIIPAGRSVPGEITAFLLHDRWQDAHKSLLALDKLTLQFSLSGAKDSARELADRIARESHTLERLRNEIANPNITDTGEGIAHKMMTVAGLEKLLPSLDAEAERQKNELRRAEETAGKRGILRDLITLIRDLTARAPVSLDCGDEVYALLPWALREQGAIARAEAAAKQIQDKTRAEAEAEAGIERRETERVKAEIEKVEAAERRAAQIAEIATLDVREVIDRLFSLPTERVAVRDLLQGAFNCQAGAEALQRLETWQREAPDQMRGLLLQRLRTLEAQRKNSSVRVR